MKRVRYALLLALLSVANAKADSVFGIYAGAQGWRTSTDGGFANNGDIQPFGFDDETQTAFYVAVEHPVPLIPNFKVRRTSLDTSGSTNLTQSFSFGDQQFTANTDVQTNIDVTHTDVILYYEVFDTNLFSFDFGLNGKYVEGDLIAQDLGETERLVAEEFASVVPLLYSKIQIGVPFTGWGAYAEGSFLTIDDNTLLDYQVALTYAVIENLAVDVGFEVGYRSFQLELDDVDGITTDLEFDGIFAGIEVHF